MNFLNPEALKKHLSAEHNYLEHLNIEETRVSENNENETLLEEPDKESKATLIVVEKEPLGRRNSNVPEFLRKTVAVLAHTSDETQTEIGKTFGINQPSVAHAMNGRNGGGHINPELRTLTNNLKESQKTRREEIEDVALLKTLSTLNILTPDDIECLGAKDKADVAVKLSKVASNMRDKVVNQDNRTLLIIKAPPVREELHYKTIQVG
jgi:hypothetical protein